MYTEFVYTEESAGHEERERERERGTTTTREISLLRNLDEIARIT